MPVIPDFPTNTDYGHANYTSVMVGNGKVVHAALHYSHNDYTKPVTVCGKDWRATADREITTATCRRCLGRLPKLDRWNRKVSYMANRDAELDALSAGVAPEVATAWREDHYARVTATA